MKKMSKKKSPKKKASKKSMESRAKLPPRWRGADVLRGAGLHHRRLEDLVEKKRLAEWDATRPLYLVVNEGSAEDEHASTFQVFADKETALRVAQAHGNGNIDHRVLTITEQTLVIATWNTL